MRVPKFTLSLQQIYDQVKTWHAAVDGWRGSVADALADVLAVARGGTGPTVGTVDAAQSVEAFFTPTAPEPTLDVNTSAGTNPSGTLASIGGPDGTWRIPLGALGSTWRFYPLGDSATPGNGFRIEGVAGGGIAAQTVNGSPSVVDSEPNGTLDGNEVLLLSISGDGAAFSLEVESGPLSGGELLGGNTGLQPTWTLWGLTNNTAAPRVRGLAFTPEGASGALAPAEKVDGLYDRLGGLDWDAAEVGDVVAKGADGKAALVAPASGSPGGGGGTVVATPGLPFGRPLASGREALTDARARLAMARAPIAGDTSAELVVVAFGDSQVSRPHLCNGLRDALLALGIPDAYGRFVEMDLQTAQKGPMPAHTVTFGGTWNESDVYEPDYAGPARKPASGGVGASVTITAAASTPDWGADSTVLYRRHSAGGSFRWRVDGSAWTTVNTNGAEGLGEAEVSSGGVLEVEVTAGTVTLSGFVLQSASKRGFSIMKCGNGGSRIEQHDNAGAAGLQRHLEVFRTPNLLVLMSAGGNDAKVALLDEGKTGAQAAAEVEAVFEVLLDQFAAVRLGTTPSRGVPVLFVGVGDADTDPAATDADIEAVRQAQYAVLAERAGIAFVDARQALGEWSAANYVDELHFGPTGGRTLAQIIAHLLS